jgi:hypothetical protein
MSNSIFEKNPTKGNLRIKCPKTGLWYWEAHSLVCDQVHAETHN